MEKESHDQWQLEKKKEAYELYITDLIDMDEYYVRLKLIDEIIPSIQEK